MKSKTIPETSQEALSLGYVITSDPVFAAHHREAGREVYYLKPEAIWAWKMISTGGMRKLATDRTPEQASIDADPARKHWEKGGQIDFTYYYADEPPSWGPCLMRAPDFGSPNKRWRIHRELAREFWGALNTDTQKWWTGSAEPYAGESAGLFFSDRAVAEDLVRRLNTHTLAREVKREVWKLRKTGRLPNDEEG